MATFWLFLAFLATAQCNHGHHGHHSHHAHHAHHAPTAFATPLVSSFSHKLPGNSYMSVTRYFGGAGPTAVGAVADRLENQSRQGHAVQDNFHPWNPRFQVNLVKHIF